VRAGGLGRVRRRDEGFRSASANSPQVVARTVDPIGAVIASNDRPQSDHAAVGAGASDVAQPVGRMMAASAAELLSELCQAYRQKPWSARCVERRTAGGGERPGETDREQSRHRARAYSSVIVDR
jgi:hypothetical protein